MTQKTAAQLESNFLEQDPQEWTVDLLDSVPVLDAAWQQDANVTIGASGAGYDVTLHGNTAGANVQWDASDNQLEFNGASDLLFTDNRGIYFGDGSDASLTHDNATGVELSLADNDADAFEVKQGSNTYLTIDTTNSVERVEAKKPLTLEKGIDHSVYWELFDDFNYQAGFTEADKPWVLNEGDSGDAANPNIAADYCGVMTLTCGTRDGTTAHDASHLVGAVPVRAEDGGLVFEARLHIDLAGSVAVNAGFTDQTGLEEPFSISGTAYTSNAGDAAVFVYDTDCDTLEWHAAAVDGTTDDASCGTFGVSPTVGTYQTLRIEVDSTGGTISYFVDGVLEKTITGTGVSPDVDLYPTVIACTRSTPTAQTVDVDYIYVGCTRG